MATDHADGSPDANGTPGLTAVRTDSRDGEDRLESILAYADDELISAHTLAHLCDLAGPAMEPMLAILSYVQDDTGHSVRWYELVAGQLGRSVDDLVFLREPAEFRSSRLADVESTDWFVVVAKNLLYKSADILRQEALLDSGDPELRGLVERTLDEDRFHERFWSIWAGQLREWNERRLRETCLSLARFGGSLFDFPAFWTGERSGELHQVWAEAAGHILPVSASELLAAGTAAPRGSHRPEFTTLIEGMQSVHRAYPGGVW
jgi:ring-1,2-phenylacetyl-CoA epoxidase subunit PaaC